MKKVILSMPEQVFDEKRSGATIAWSYFFPNVPVPLLLKYIEDGDRYVFLLPESRALLAYVYANRFSFEDWDRLVKELEDEKTRALAIEKGTHYEEYFSIIVEQIMNKATLVSFEGYECYLAGANNIFKSDVGNRLARLKPPLGIAVDFHGDALTVSLRSTSELDVSVLAQKYGGNGHPHASGFRVTWGDPLPWKVLKEKENEDSRD